MNRIINLTTLSTSLLILGCGGGTNTPSNTEPTVNQETSISVEDNTTQVSIPDEHTTPNITLGAREVIATPLDQGTIFIANNGTGEACSLTLPCNLEEGIKRSQAGDTVFLKGGIYHLSSLLTKSKNPEKKLTLKSGERENPVLYESYPNELAIFDGTGLEEDEYGSIIVFNNTHLRRIAVTNMKKSAIIIRGNHNLLEGVESHHNHNVGIHIYNRTETEPNDIRSSYNTITDCIVHHNSDANTQYQGGNADGISISYGMNNIIRHNTVYSNSDDGIDTWRSINTLIEYSISYDNGKGEKGNGKGFKLGGDRDPNSLLGTGVTARFNLAFNNKSSGYDDNSAKHLTLTNNTAYHNGGYGFVVFDQESSLVNNISYKNTQGEVYQSDTPQTNNSWQIEEVSDNDFISLDTLSQNFLYPKENSELFSIGAYGSL